jgi:ketosteroid isomerase-like protein
VDDVGVIRAAVDALNRDDDVAAREFFHPEGHRIVPIRAALEDTVYEGPEAWREFRDDARDAWSQIAFEMQDLRPLPDGRVLALGRVIATARATGADVTMDCGLLFTVRDGRITDIQTFTDPDEAVRATG